MRRTTRNAAYLTMVLLVLAGLSSAQVATGTPPYASFGGGPFDTVNLGNLNVHIAIPVVHKAGRGMAFTYDLNYDNSVWYPVGAIGSQTWQPVLNWGWRGQTEVATGYLSHNTGQTKCFDGGPQWYWGWRYTNYVYHDPWGAAHSFPGVSLICSNDNLSGSTTDGSGFSIIEGSTIKGSDGQAFVPPVNQTTGSATATDANGNKISVNSSGVFTDTLGTTALTVTGSGSPSSPLLFTYTSPSGAVGVQLNYSIYNIKTNFNCSGISEYTANGVYLVSSVVLPDGSSYGFSYEQNGTYYTGRLKTITLPTGGTITYTYTGSNGGISCADGSTIGLTRTLSPGGPWNYTRTQISGNHWQTKVTTPPDPSVGNDTVIDFAKDSSSNPTNNFYETQRLTYQGSSGSGMLLSTSYTCYNGNSVGSPANCATTAVSSPILRITAFNSLPNPSGVEDETDSVYDSGGYGLIQEVDAYDYGSGGVGSLLQKTLTSYASLGNGIIDRPSSVTIKDASNNVKAYTAYTYDEGGVTATSGTPQHVSITGSRGNVTTVAGKASGSTTLYRHFTYYDTGMLKTSTDVNGAAATYEYSSNSCGNAFITKLDEPLSLSRSFTWDCNGGALTQVTDENTNPTNYAYDNMWRPIQVSYPDGGQSTATYHIVGSGSNIQTSSKIDSSHNLTGEVLLDGLGRPIQQ
jgi:hypothetical protein